MAGIVTMLSLRAARMRSKNARYYCVGDAGGPSTLRGVLSPHSTCRGDTTNHALPEVIAHQPWFSQLHSILALQPPTSRLPLTKSCQCKHDRLLPKGELVSNGCRNNNDGADSGVRPTLPS